MDRLSDLARGEKLAREMTHGAGAQAPDMDAVRYSIANRLVPRDVAYGEAGLEGGVPTDPYLGLSPLDLIPTGAGAKLAGFGTAALSALGATAIASKASQGAKFNTLANALRGQRGATAWHGSPHLFDKFKNEAIGTGEGAQAYGHGLYLAESKGVADSYKTALTKQRGAFDAKVGNVPLSEAARNFDQTGYTEAFANKYFDLMKNGKTEKQALSQITKQLEKRIQKNVFPLDVQGSQAALKFFKSNKIDYPTGNLYKTDIPDTHIDSMLDWDKPISEQHPDVQAAIMPIIESTAKSFPDIRNADLSQLTGANIYKSYTSHRGGDQKAASEMLQQAGIPGIKYLDAGSREVGGTRNFVIFNPEDIRILERNAQPTGQIPWSESAIPENLTSEQRLHTYQRKYDKVS